MPDPTEAEKLLVEVYRFGRWEHSSVPEIDSVYIIPEELKDKITLYLQFNNLIGV
jgi:hypothetical protein